MAVYQGACHCGAIAFEVEGELRRVSICNCSICTKKAYAHWIVPLDRFQLLTPNGPIQTYRFNTGTAKHHFCSVCGVAPFYVARSDPDKIDVNARCLDGVDLSLIAVDEFDGRNWEEAQACAQRRQARGE